MTVAEAANGRTTALLLDTLREASGRADLGFAAPPTPLSGGFYAEMLRFRLSDPPPGLDRELVARIIPNPSLGAAEATIQREVADQGFPTPAVRLVVDETSPLGRYLIVMDRVDGHPPLAGLGIATILVQLPALVRRLPDQLAATAARLHALDPEPLAAALANLDGGVPVTASEFVEDQAGRAESLGEPRLAAAGRELLRTEPRAGVRAITHGDLHPFNLLDTAGGTVLVDWTLTAIAHPAFTLAFTELMLANPPIPGPGVGVAALRPVAHRMARRFLATYRSLTADRDEGLDDETLAWHRAVHSLRILVEVAGWDAAGTRPEAHPWLSLEPVACATLGLR